MNVTDFQLNANKEKYTLNGHVNTLLYSGCTVHKFFMISIITSIVTKKYFTDTESDVC